MIRLGTTEPQKPENNWQRQLDEFVKANRQELAALSWGLYLAKGESKDTLGIDLKPKPHFVYCPKEAIEKLNHKVKNQLQEILGVVDAHQPDKEVLIIGIGTGELKLIQFEPQPAPPDCFEQVGEEVDTLLDRLEQGLSEQIEV
ncbi:beta-carboxysome assembly chaperone CcmS [Lyngbya aestuarii]|uniref:beta-carboxysome assembly chaperone CcmS n=1 Tax=Lyngbya aestuarii TaxID=118322 RepID=UPI00403D894C